MNRDAREGHAAAATGMKRLLFPMMTLLVLGQLIYIFTAFDVAGTAADLLWQLRLSLGR